VNKDEAIFRVLKKLIIASKPVRFNGDGYSEEWKAEAEKRGLTNIRNVPEALEAYIRKENIQMFEKLNVFSEKEVIARADVEFEKFVKKVQIESRVLADMAINHIVPTAVEYQTMLLENVKNLKEVFSPEEYEILSDGRRELIKEIAHHVASIKSLRKEMIEARKVANNIENVKDQAYAYDKSVKPFLKELREHIDKLELIVDNEKWPLPKYRELLFTR
jgi:glutamine synthetase